MNGLRVGSGMRREKNGWANTDWEKRVQTAYFISEKYWIFNQYHTHFMLIAPDDGGIYFHSQTKNELMRIKHNRIFTRIVQLLLIKTIVYDIVQ